VRQALIKSGNVILEEVPAPNVSKKNILVKVSSSCVSIGTEMAGVKMSGLPLYQRALKQPENVKRVLEMVRYEGIATTYERVSGQLTAGTPTGYSASGYVIDIGENVENFKIGDRVACAGAGIANHAEIIDVPTNLAVKIPESISQEEACTVTLGAIALQGVRRSSPSIGETFVVVGLGILGQITTQILSANGIKVIGIDIEKERIKTALGNGMDLSIDPNQDNYIEKVHEETSGIGADAVIITAASKSNQLISEAMKACRKKGRVVLVGDVGLNLNRADFYSKEIDFFISCSYGPGRYDPFYEEEGQDYPFPYVRWTENRNMQAYLDLISKSKIKINTLSPVKYAIEDVKEAYNSLKVEGTKPLIVLLNYTKNDNSVKRKIYLRDAISNKGKINIALVGASSFAKGVHLPNLMKMKDKFSLQAVMSKTGSNAKGVAEQYKASYCTTNYEDILNDESIDLIMIANRSNLHGEMVIQGLKAKKNVFVEKPLTIYKEDLEQIKTIYNNGCNQLLMVGFNRRFSVPMRIIKDNITNASTPIIINYRMNAGYLPPEHWTQGEENKSRNLGEACHIYDLFNYLANSYDIENINAYSIKPKSKHWKSSDNFVANIKYRNGSICTLTYTSMGNKLYPKESMEIFYDNKVITMEDYKEVSIYKNNKKEIKWSSKNMQKGQFEELKALSIALNEGKDLNLSLEEQLIATETSFSIEDLI